MYHYQRAPDLRSPCSATAAGAPPTSAASAPLPPPLDVNAGPPPQRRPQQRVPHCSSFYCSVPSSGGREAATPCQHLRGRSMHRPTQGPLYSVPAEGAGLPASPSPVYRSVRTSDAGDAPVLHVVLHTVPAAARLPVFCCLAVTPTPSRHWHRSC
jgi:hypothetical protein